MTVEPDSTSIPERRFERDVNEIPVIKFKGRGEDELANIGLYLGLRAPGIPNNKSLEDLDQFNSLEDSHPSRDKPPVAPAGVFRIRKPWVFTISSPV